MSKDQLIKSGLLEQYVLGLTTPEENSHIEEIAGRDPEVQEEIEAMRQALDQYVNQQSIPPPPSLKQEVMDAIQVRQPVVEEEFSRVSLSRVLLALSVVGLISLAWFSFRQRQQFDHQYSAMVSEYHLCQKELESLEAKMAPITADLSTLIDQNTRHVHVRSLDPKGDALLVVYYNPDQTDALLHVVKMPAAPEGHQYQVWADVEGKMIDMGTLGHVKKNSLHHLRLIPKAESLNVTIEPIGGSDHPTVETLCANGRV
ncbi:MAG: anti-sigma factor [Saprospiraceae bacterium]